MLYLLLNRIVCIVILMMWIRLCGIWLFLIWLVVWLVICVCCCLMCNILMCVLVVC